MANDVPPAAATDLGKPDWERKLIRVLRSRHYQWLQRRQRSVVVLSRDECRQLFAALDGTSRLMAELMYGSGLRLFELTGCAFLHCHPEIVEGSLSFDTPAVREYFVYILASRAGVLYIGVTNDLGRRLFEHREKLIPGFASKYNVIRLVSFESFGDIREAIAREKQLKGWRRQKKITLIGRENPTWQDLSRAWGNSRDASTSSA